METSLVLLQRIIRFLARILMLVILTTSPSLALNFDENFFPVPDLLRPNIQFWISIFTLYSSNQIVIHDSEDLSIIYEVIDLKEVFPDGRISEKQKWDYADSIKEKYVQILKKLASAEALNPDTLAARERYIFNLFHPDNSPHRFLRAVKNIRGQQGLRDQFRQGLIRSGRFRNHINRIFREYGLPQELAALPFVESLFHPRSYSKVGAAGIWQFTRRTGKRFLRINYFVDERFDPIKATIAAAKLLKQNYETLGSWPVAITAYNHGVHGMERAIRTVGTDDISEIIKNYSSRSFKFASRNFYAEFLAAVEVSQNYQIYFGPIKFEPELKFVEYKLPRSRSIRQLAQELNLPKQVIQEYNPALRKSVIASRRKIPAGYKIKIPFRADAQYNVAMSRIYGHEKYVLDQAIVQDLPRATEAANGSAGETASSVAAFQNAKLTAELKTFEMKSDNQNATRQEKDHATEWIEVKPYETLGHFADWLKIPTSELRRLNGLAYREAIHIDQKIKVVFKNVSREEFFSKRMEFKQSKENEFFSVYEVNGIEMHRVKTGDNIWQLCKAKYNVPFWLVEKYNPDIDLKQLRVGQTIIFPIIELKQESGQ